MAFLPLEDGNLFYQTMGNGEPILMIQGMARTHHHWFDFADALSPYYQLILADNRGTGQTTTRLTWRSSVHDMAKDYIALLEHLQTGPIRVVGISLGGMIAQALGILRPDLVKSLVLINTSCTGNGTRQVSWFGTAKMIASAVRPAKEVEIMAPVLLSQSQVNHDKVVNQWKGVPRDQTVSHVNAARQLRAALNFRVNHQLDQISCPTLVMVGNQDKLVPPQNATNLAEKIPNAKLVTIPEGGHEMTLDMTETIVSLVHEFHEKRDEPDAA